MKTKLSILTLVIFFYSTFLYSQIIKDYGMKIGLTSSNIIVKNAKPIIVGSNSYMIDYPNGQLVSPTISLWAKVIDDKILSLEFETSYIIKGLSETQTEMITTADNPSAGTLEKITTIETIKYLQLNINGQLKYCAGAVTVYGIIGPAVSYILGSENFIIIKENKKDFIFGYNLGIGLDLSKWINKSIFIEARYNGDFTEFYKSGTEFWNKVWIFNVGTSL